MQYIITAEHKSKAETDCKMPFSCINKLALVSKSTVQIGWNHANKDNGVEVGGGRAWGATTKPGKIWQIFTCKRPMSHLEPSETKMSEGLMPIPLYSLSQMASLKGPLPCSAPYLHCTDQLSKASATDAMQVD